MANKDKKVKLTDLSVSDLQEKLKDQAEEMKKMRFSHNVTPLTNPNEIKSLRRDIARLKTELTARKS